MSDCKVEIRATKNNTGIEIYYDGRFVAKTNYSEHSERFIVWLNDAINKANGTNTSVYEALHKPHVTGSAFDAVDLWNEATKLSTLECNGYWKALRDLERLSVIKIGGLEPD